MLYKTFPGKYRQIGGYYMKRLVYGIILSTFIVVLAACGQNNEDANNDAAETITIEHDLGETEVSKNPESIVVFDFGILDTLDILDIDVDGVPRGNIPTYLEEYTSEQYEDVGSLKEPDFDKIAEIDPDVIIISGRQSTLYDELSNIAPTIHLDIDTTNYMESFESNLSVIAELFDVEEEIDQKLEDIHESIDELQTIADDYGQESLIILANDDKISAYGPHSRFGLIHDVFGVPAVDKDIEASTHGQNVSFEYVLETDPDLLYVIDRSAVVEGESAAEQIVENKLVQKTSAYENDNIIYLDPNYWYLSGGGLVSIQAMIDEIQESLENIE